MRTILSLMKGYRQAELEVGGASKERIAETGDMFEFIDQELSFFNRSPTATGNKMEEVMTSSDFTYAIGTFVSRRMEPAYNEKRFEFEQFVSMDTTPNYLAVQRYQRKAALDDLEWTGEKDEARPGSYVDATPRSFQVEDWQKQFDFSFRALVNDDLGYFDDCATEMGISARRTLEKFVSRMLTNATSIARLVGLGALYATTGRLTSARVSTARMGFNQRTDARANPINTTLRYIIHHPGLVDTVRVIRASQLVPELATNAANVIAGDFVPVEDPYMAGTAPNLPWYALSDYRRDNIKPLILARRQGMAQPVIVRKASDVQGFSSLSGGGGAVSIPFIGDFATNNVVVKVWDTFGTYIDPGDNTHNGNLYDYRGAYYSSGTAP
jgi:hypothetical protein